MRHLFVIAICLLNAGCVGPTYREPTDGEPSATVLEQSDDNFFVCHSAYIRAVDGFTVSFKQSARGVEIKPGKHTITVWALSGLQGLNFLGCAFDCTAFLSFTAESNRKYQLFHEKDAEPNRVNLSDVETKELVASSTCRHSNGDLEQAPSDEQPAE